MRKTLTVAIITITLILVLLVVITHGVKGGPIFPRSELFIDVADAYSGEGNALGSILQHALHVQYKVYSEGSFELAREIAMESVPSTIFISVAKEAYYPAYLDNYAPDWAIAFASDELVLAYSNASLNNPTALAIVDALNQGFAENDTHLAYLAFMNLTSGRVLVGISNPLTDPAGYRAFLSLEIAGYLYAGNESMFLDRLIANSGNRSATNAAELIAPLEAGQLQFLFIYKSAAISHHLKYIELPPQLSLGDPRLSSFYSRFQYTTAGKTFVGEPIYLFISIPGNSNNSTLAQSAIELLLRNDSFLASYGLTPLKPALLFTWGQTPQFINELLNDGIVSLPS